MCADPGGRGLADDLTAETLRIPVGTVRSRLDRGRPRDALNQLGSFEDPA
ncbi:hypothetical protein [Streptomyces sp. 4F14]